jgi:hypothetical protein
VPAATDAQVPKPLTYTLMYHFLWCVLFFLSALTLFGVFLASGRGFGEAVVPPLILVALGLIAGFGFLATYVVRVQLLLGQVTWEEAFRWSSRSSWAVIAFAPALFALWKLALEPLARLLWGATWSVPLQMTVTMAEVEVVIWWISHLMSVRGLAKGRKRYLAPAAAPAAPSMAAGASLAG